MNDRIENVTHEMLKKIQSELSAARERDHEILNRLGQIESSIARLGRDRASDYEEQITDRHNLDKLRERIERIEQRLEITG